MSGLCPREPALGDQPAFHHDPWRTDAEIDAMVARHATAPVRVFAAYDGMIIDLP